VSSAGRPPQYLSLLGDRGTDLKRVAEERASSLNSKAFSVAAAWICTAPWRAETACFPVFSEHPQHYWKNKRIFIDLYQ
jgi:hypothetical protein